MINLHIVFWKEGIWWVAKCLENSVTSQGKTYEEAKRNINEALELSLEDEKIRNITPVEDIRTETFSFALA